MCVKETNKQPFNGPLSGTTQVSQYQKGKTNLDFTEARDSEWQWHRLDHMQVCTSLQIDNHANTSPLSFLQAGCPSCRPTNSVKALKVVKLSELINYRRKKRVSLGVNSSLMTVTYPSLQHRLEHAAERKSQNITVAVILLHTF